MKKIVADVQNDFEVSEVNGYITVQEAAKKWGISPRQVQILCKDNRITGAVRMSRIWIIPEDAEKPTDGKKHHTGGKDNAAERHI